MKRKILIPINPSQTQTQTQEVKTMMSQKAAALAAYKQKADSYSTRTEWPVLSTVEQQLVPVGDDIPTNIDAFVAEKVGSLHAKVEARFGGDAYPLFVRACPLNPRPGVLESSRADNIDEVTVIAHRIISTMMSPDPSDSPMYESGLIDPNGMLIVQPFINAHASAVVAPNNYILMGRDNDGITAGKDGLRVAIPLGNDPRVNRDFDLLGLDPEHIEIEFVSERTSDNLSNALRNSNYTVQQRLAMVQLRGSEGHRPISPAPKGVTISGTFHGTDRITINHIHLVSDNTDEQLDLMEQALREGMPEGSVVLHPNGSHLSHHAGQCFKYGVPYIASAEPQVGEQWTQAALGWVVLDNDGSYEPQAYDPLDFTHAFIEGFDIGFSNFARQHGWLSNHFHQFIGGPIGDAEQTAKLAGAYTAWLINATLSVGFGEIRHTYGNASNSSALVMATAHAVYGADAWQEVTGGNMMASQRREYYTTVEQNPSTLESVIGLFSFLERVYSLDWSSSYGGAKYGESCMNGRLLAESVIKFFANSTDSNFKTMISTANLVEHNVHNNGFFFNKFISKSALDWGTDPSSVRVTPHEFFSVYYAADHIMKSYPQTLNDTTHITDLAKTITISDMKKTPLGEMDNIIAKSMPSLATYFRHPQGKYSQTHSNTFLRCGVKNCDRCAAHDEYINQSLTSETSLPITHTYDSDFPVEAPPSSDDVVAYLKMMSSAINNNKVDINEQDTVTAIATVVKKGVPNIAHKYIANIIAHMNTESLLLYSKKTKGDE